MIAQHRQAVLSIFLLATSVGCNTRAHQCDKLADTIASARNGLRAVSGSSPAKAVDRTIFSIARSKAELNALDLPDVQLDDDRLRFVGLLDRYTIVLRAFADVMSNHDAADVEDAMSGIQSLARDERAVVDDVVRHCR